MVNDPYDRDLLIFGCSITLAAIIAWGFTKNLSLVNPVWPVRLWLWYFRTNAFQWMKRYPDSRREFSRREQFLAAFCVWIFTLIVLGEILFGCNLRVGCISK